MKKLITVLALLGALATAPAVEVYQQLSLISAPVTNAAAASGLVAGTVFRIRPGTILAHGLEVVCTNAQATTNQGTITINFTTTQDGTNWLATNWIPVVVPVGSNATRWHTNLPSYLNSYRGLRVTNIVNAHGITNVVTGLKLSYSKDTE